MMEGAAQMGIFSAFLEQVLDLIFLPILLLESVHFFSFVIGKGIFLLIKNIKIRINTHQ